MAGLAGCSKEEPSARSDHARRMACSARSSRQTNTIRRRFPERSAVALVIVCGTTTAATSSTCRPAASAPSMGMPRAVIPLVSARRITAAVAAAAASTLAGASYAEPHSRSRVVATAISRSAEPAWRRSSSATVSTSGRCGCREP
ncbi:hypothetical protein BJF78_10505 [Pseudonocardia sp. CNS-139]|nr:hypothetical protein BJF78_10505 [Pseudonocardia sp. CNS-139]